MSVGSYEQSAASTKSARMFRMTSTSARSQSNARIDASNASPSSPRVTTGASKSSTRTRYVAQSPSISLFTSRFIRKFSNARASRSVAHNARGAARHSVVAVVPVPLPSSTTRLSRTNLAPTSDMTNSLAVNPADHANAPVDPANAFVCVLARWASTTRVPNAVSGRLSLASIAPARASVASNRYALCLHPSANSRAVHPSASSSAVSLVVVAVAAKSSRVSPSPRPCRASVSILLHASRATRAA